MYWIKQFIVNQIAENSLKWIGGFIVATTTGIVSPQDIGTRFASNYHALNRKLEYAVNYVEASTWQYFNPVPATYR